MSIRYCYCRAYVKMSVVNLSRNTFSGNFSMRALGTPLIYKSLFEAAKRVPNPNATELAAGRTTVYDTWMSTFPSKSDKYNTPQWVKLLNMHHFARISWGLVSSITCLLKIKKTNKFSVTVHDFKLMLCLMLYYVEKVTNVWSFAIVACLRR